MQYLGQRGLQHAIPTTIAPGLTDQPYERVKNYLDQRQQQLLIVTVLYKHVVPNNPKWFPSRTVAGGSSPGYKGYGQ